MFVKLDRIALDPEDVNAAAVLPPIGSTIFVAVILPEPFSHAALSNCSVNVSRLRRQSRLATADGSSHTPIAPPANNARGDVSPPLRLFRNGLVIFDIACENGLSTTYTSTIAEPAPVTGLAQTN